MSSLNAVCHGWKEGGKICVEKVGRKTGSEERYEDLERNKDGDKSDLPVYVMLSVRRRKKERKM